MQRATAIVHVNPALGAAFTQYSAELEAKGQLGHAAGQRFIYVIDGALAIDESTLIAGDYAYIPEGCDRSVRAESDSRLAVIEKRYRPMRGVDTPGFFTGRESASAAQSLADDDSLQVRMLLPDDPAHDFAVNVMIYQPGASLSMVEIHVMEHGLLMLEGGGIYRLSDCWYPVSAGDFIWMAPYCPQWFGALGRSPAKYLIYKDANRHPL
jgi:(S)-ureidoglycine aminohydrolase